MNEEEKEFAETVSEQVPMWMDRIAASGVYNPSSPAINTIELLVQGFLGETFDGLTRGKAER